MGQGGARRHGWEDRTSTGVGVRVGHGDADGFGSMVELSTVVGSDARWEVLWQNTEAVAASKAER